MWLISVNFLDKSSKILLTNTDIKLTNFTLNDKEKALIKLIKKNFIKYFIKLSNLEEFN